MQNIFLSDTLAKQQKEKQEGQVANSKLLYH